MTGLVYNLAGKYPVPSQESLSVTRSRIMPRKAVQEDCMRENDPACKSMTSFSKSNKKSRTRTGTEARSKHGHITSKAMGKKSACNHG